MQGTTFLSFSSVSFGISFEHAVQLSFTVFLYSPFPDNYAFLSLSPSQIKNIQSADTVPVHGHSPLVLFHCFKNKNNNYTDKCLKQKHNGSTYMNFVQPTYVKKCYTYIYDKKCNKEVYFKFKSYILPFQKKGN